MSTNDHVEEYLNDYLEIDKPQYAVMLTGKWGCGKTFFIDTYLNDKYPEKKRYLKISLYGLSDINQINDEFYAQLHPKLNSKGMKLAANVGKGLLKTTLKIDLDSDGKSDGSVALQTPDINLPDFLTNIGERLLIFDDLERCNIPTSQVLGYINTLVEQDHHKAIILANENEIPNQEKDRYSQVKEKLIGQTLELHSPIDKALETFLENMDESRVKLLYRENIEIIKSLYQQSETQNLRILQQLLWTFERFSKCLTDEQWKKPEAVLELTKLVFTIGFLLKGNSKYHLNAVKSDLFKLPKDNPYSDKLLETITVDEVWALIDPNFHWLDKDQHPELIKKIGEIEQQFSDVQFSNEILSEEILKDLFLKGVVDNGKIQPYLKVNKLFIEKQVAAEWQILWHSFSYSNDEMEQALTDTYRKFGEYKYRRCGEILHIAGILFDFANQQVLPKSTKDIETDLKSYIDHLYENELFYGPEINTFSLNFESQFSFNSYYNLHFKGLKIKEFSNVKEYLRKKINQAELNSHANKAKELIELSKTDFQQFQDILCQSNPETGMYLHKPVLAQLDPKSFVNHIISATPEYQKLFFRFFEIRYRNDRLNSDLGGETKWLQAVSQEFDTVINSLSRFDKYRLRQMKNKSLDTILKKLIKA